MAKHTLLKILWCSHRKIFKVCSAIFQHYEWKGSSELGKFAPLSHSRERSKGYSNGLHHFFLSQFLHDTKMSMGIFFPRTVRLGNS